MSDDADRRRHTRAPLPVAVDLHVGAASVVVTRVIDVSTGGALLEVEGGAEPPALAQPMRATLRRGDVVIERHAHVVRVRWGGRERGAPVPAAFAIVFDDADADAAARLEALLLL